MNITSSSPPADTAETIPTLADILGTEAAAEFMPAQPAPPPAGAAQPPLAVDAGRGYATPSQTYAAQPQGLNMTPEQLAGAIASAMRPAPTPAAPFDALSALKPEVRETFGEFIDSGFAPVVQNVVKHFESRFEEQEARHARELAAFKQQFGALEAVERNVQSTQRSVLDTSLRAANPDWDTIRTSPEWETLLDKTDPMTGTTNKQLIEWRMRHDGTAGAVDAYNALLRQVRGSAPRAASNTLASLATPQASSATAPPATQPNSQQEMQATAMALEKVRTKPNKTDADLKTMNQLYDRLKALAKQSPVVGVSASL